MANFELDQDEIQLERMGHKGELKRQFSLLSVKVMQFLFGLI